jgi:hypothetical protein
VAKARAVDSQAGRILSRPDDIGRRMMIELEGTEWYLTFLAETKSRRGGGNAAEVRAGAERDIEIARGITDADAQCRQRRTRGEAEAVIEIGAHGNGGAMNVTNSQVCIVAVPSNALLWVPVLLCCISFQPT